MKAPRILLIGIQGVYNFGCEAIVRGTEAILRQEYPTASILYASNRVKDDQAQLTGSTVEVIDRGQAFVRRYSPQRLTRRLLRLVGVNWSPMQDSVALLRDVDVVLSIGGDIYTSNRMGRASLALPKFGDAALRKGVPYVLWGASVGPFKEDRQTEKIFQAHLKRVSLITARETATVDYLASLDVRNNVVACADPAYIVAPEIISEKCFNRKQLTIGINLSPISAHAKSTPLENIIRSQARTIEKLIKALHCQIILVPHVVCNFNEADDDFRYLQKVQNAIRGDLRASVEFLDGYSGFVNTKKRLVKCDMVIAARMHCAINSLAAHVPTLLLAYSSKAPAMCQYVYGNCNWTLPIEAFTAYDRLKRTVDAMLRQSRAIQCQLRTRIPEIQRESLAPIERIRLLLMNAR